MLLENVMTKKVQNEFWKKRKVKICSVKKKEKHQILGQRMFEKKCF